MSADRTMPLINWYAREQLYRHMYEECNRLEKKGRGDTIILFWKAAAAGMDDNTSEAISGLHSLKGKSDASLAALSALRYFLKVEGQKTGRLDSAALDEVNRDLPAAQGRSNNNAKILAASFNYCVGDMAGAAGLLDPICENAMDMDAPELTTWQKDACRVRGWCELAVDPQTLQPLGDPQRAMAYFEKCSPGDTDAIMAKSKYHQLVGGQRGTPRALDHLNEAIAKDGSFFPALLEKAKVMISLGEWSQALDAAHRVLSLNDDNMGALKIVCLEMATNQADPHGLAEQLQQLLRSMSKNEPVNAKLFHRTAQLFSRFAGRDAEVLQVTQQMAKKALAVDPNDGAAVTELADQMLMLGKYKDASDHYGRACQIDPENMPALHGMLQCHIIQKNYSDAEQQIELFKVLGTMDSAQVVFLDAMLAWRRNHQLSKQLELLESAYRMHFEEMDRAPVADVFDLKAKLNPEFLIDVAREYMVHSTPSGGGGGTGGGSSSVPLPVQRGLSVLEKVLEIVPGSLEARIMKARAEFFAGQMSAAQRTLQKCLSLDPACSEAHLLMAQIALAQGNNHLANSSLEQALSYNFEIRKSPIFHRVKAQVLSNQDTPDQALKQLEEAMELPGVRHGGVDDGTVSLAERANIFIEMANVLGKLNRLSEAQKVIADARSLFRGTPSEVQIIVADSELQIKRNDFDSAIHMLSQVKTESPAYVHAQMVKANVFLMHRHDKRAYTQCYRDLVDFDPCASSHVHLGEALMRIQAPEAAVEAFKQALELNPQDMGLAAKIGRALVSTHDYQRAINYYKDALKSSPRSVDLLHDLAKLLIKLRKFDEAIRMLGPHAEAPNASSGLEDTTHSMQRIQSLLLLADVHEESHNAVAMKDTLMEALELQRKVNDGTRDYGPDMVAEQKKVMTTICFRLGKFAEGEDKNDDSATGFYREALKARPEDEPSMQALCNLYIRRGDRESCQKQCEKLLNIVPDHEGATIMLADLLFMDSDEGAGAAATKRYQDVLKENPNNYTALQKLILLLKRAGQLDDVPRYLQLAERANPRAFSHPGLHYCKGLHHWARNDVHEAVKHFNFARRDGEWGRDALANMIQIYRNPNNEDMWDQANGDEVSDGHHEALKIAESLLEELRSMLGEEPYPMSFRVLEVYAKLAKVQASRSSDKKEQYDAAEAAFIKMLEEDREYVPAMLGLATVFRLEGNQNKARNVLKKIAKMSYVQELADEFEKCYLHLSKLYIDRNKYDLAIDLCDRALKFNQSCGKAWEIKGEVSEKEMSYKDAASAYEQAWKCAHEASAPIGYKLAFNYLKAKRYVEAIDVCQKVLRQYPDYQGIQKEILEKCFQSLRP